MRMEQLCSSIIPSLRFWYWLRWRVCLHQCSTVQQSKRLFRCIMSEKSSTKRSRVFRTERVPFNNNKPIFNLRIFRCARIFPSLSKYHFSSDFSIFLSRLLANISRQPHTANAPQFHGYGTKKDEIKWKVTDQSNVGLEFKMLNITIHFRLVYTL